MYRTKTGTMILAAILVLVVASGALAAKQVIITATKKLNYQGQKGDAMVEGNVKIEYGTTFIYAEKLLFNSDTKIAKIDTGVRIVQDDIVITANVMTADFKTEKMTVTGNVKLELTEELAEKDAAGKPLKDVIVLLTQRMEIDINTNDFTATGGVTITKDKQKAQAAEARYIDAESKMTLTKGVVITTVDGDTVKSDSAIIYTDKETFEAEGEKIEINFTV
ncbi:MAG TPA: LPS export ABC transporter periplasmic protein LptC [Bacillota bacterium]|nr:LPS export ABC transporter periplasmic protein LptC [Bacillota bacterium]HOA15852.1 LPS export ABC transporter periplasmic protein LptC [Bacillota bacterium]HOG52943.1 LPS export ABC transporter periplasmic protein LptC [Bacillota bacterium]